MKSITKDITPSLTVKLPPQQGDTMSTNQPEEAPSNVTTDAESQEYGAQHGQTPEGQNTGSSDPDAEADSSNTGAGEPGQGTGAKGGEYS